MISVSLIPSPRIADAHLACTEQAYVAWDIARPGVALEVTAINEYRARVAGGVLLGQPAWRVRVRPAIQSLRLA